MGESCGYWAENRKKFFLKGESHYKVFGCASWSSSVLKYGINIRSWTEKTTCDNLYMAFSLKEGNKLYFGYKTDDYMGEQGKITREHTLHDLFLKGYYDV